MNKILRAMLVMFILVSSNAFALTYFVNSNGETVTTAALDAGVNYTIEASGTFLFGGWVYEADAEYFMNYGPDWNLASEYGTGSNPPDVLELTVDGMADVQWLGTLDGINFADDILSPSHIYRCYVTGEDRGIDLRIFDIDYHDNDGFLEVNIWETPPDGIPEPATMLLFGLGLAGVSIIRKFR